MTARRSQQSVELLSKLSTEKHISGSALPEEMRIHVNQGFNVNMTGMVISYLVFFPFGVSKSDEF